MSDPKCEHEVRASMGGGDEIPLGLRRQLEAFRKDLWRRKVIESVAAGVIGLVVSYLLIFILDRIWQTPGWARLVILVGGVSLFAGFAPYWLHRWVWGHRREGQLARLVARKYPGLGDRMLGAIELQKQEEGVETMSPRLRQAAMAAVAAESGKIDLVEALPTARHLKWAVTAGVLLFVAGVAFVFAPKAGLNAVERWVKPFGDVERYTFTQLDAPVSYLAVPQGEPFELSLRLAEDSVQRPEVGSARFGSQPELIAELDEGFYRFPFPGQQDEGSVLFRAGDLRHEILVEPMQRPHVIATRASVQFPEYLNLPVRTVDVVDGQLEAVAGSRVQLEMRMSRPLQAGGFGPTRSEAVGAAQAAEAAQAAGFTEQVGSLEIAGDLVRTPELRAGGVAFTIPFDWQDEFGLKGGGNFEVHVDVKPDEAPLAYLQGTERQVAILPEEVLDFEILCEDDLGLEAVGLVWKRFGGIASGSAEGFDGELELVRPDEQTRRVKKEVPFSPIALDLEPQRLILRAYAEDPFPGRARSLSEPVVVYILTREEHLQLLKAQYERAISEFEDLARQELNLLDENQRLERLDGEEMREDVNAQRLDRQELAERESVQRMEELKKKMEDIFKGATRNGEVDKEAMKGMAGALKTLQELAEEDMPKVQESLEEAGEASNTNEKTEEDIDKAVADQKEVVEKMQEAIARASEASERMEASTFVARLKKSAMDQESVATDLISNFAQLLGIREPEVDPRDQRFLSEARTRQAGISSDVRWIQEDLGHYHARTGGEVFEQVRDKMQESNINSGLEEVRDQLRKNHSYTATEASKQWAEQLAQWAKLLSDDLEKNSGGGGGGGGPDPEDEDFEFMLRVMKMIQTQQELRGRTRALEQLKRDSVGSPSS